MAGFGNLTEFKLEKVPDTIYYIPDFISKEEEEHLLDQVNSAPKPKWQQLLNRRLQNWGGLPHPKGMLAEKLPGWLQRYAEKIASLGVFDDKAPNHVLVNEYLAGQGIMPHEDGPLFYPTVTTISLGSHTLLEFFKHIQNKDQCDGTPASEGECEEKVDSFEKRHFASILLEPRSLVIVKDDMYKVHLHGIAERTQDIITDKVANIKSCQSNIGDILDRGTRVSLTIRYVPKVVKAKLLLGKR